MRTTLSHYLGVIRYTAPSLLTIAVDNLIFTTVSLRLIHSKTMWSFLKPQWISKSLSTFCWIHYKSLVTDRLMMNNISILNKYPTRSTTYLHLEKFLCNLQLNLLRWYELENYWSYTHGWTKSLLARNHEPSYTSCIKTRHAYLADSLNSR